MDRTTFIRNYMMRSGLALTMMRPWGYETPDGRRQYALPCACGETVCQGWAMVAGCMVEDHAELYGPKFPSDAATT